jgi:TATA-binding protein-associated factor Taf7
MCKLQAEGLDTFNNLYIKTYGEDEQINKLNNLCSAEDEDDEDEEDEEDEDEEDEDEDDEDYVPDLHEDDGSNHAYMFDQVKQIHKHVSNLLNYFTNTKSIVKKSSGLNYY